MNARERDWRTPGPKGWWRQRSMLRRHVSNLTWIAVSAALGLLTGVWILAYTLVGLVALYLLGVLALWLARRLL